ncbi:MAG: adenylyltransferase/cytidyltransferase family protein [Clostridia bacterium]|nr:adenylyltransferase/cytidyltransferase family protein [Clostridia bacterium]
MEKIGVVCGRFQIFHNEHLQYVMAAKEKCEHLIVGIT